MIPIRNIYYLLLYAWDALEEEDLCLLSSDPETQILDLLASVLNRGIDRVMRRGLDRSYRSQHEYIPGIRGKLNLSASIKSNLLSRGRAACDFDELSHDVLHNQILKATLGRLLLTEGIDARLRDPIRTTFRRLHEVSDIQITDRCFQSVFLHRNNHTYRLLIDVCRLLFKYLIPNEGTGQLKFRSFLQDKRRMRALFERFIRNFYKRHAEGFDVAAESIRWKDTSGSSEAMSLLPTMRTDVTLRRRSQLMVIDAKFYLDAFQEYRGRRTLRSSHLYQLFAYMKNIAATSEAGVTIEGMLIYPLTSAALNLTYNMQGTRIHIRTLDLGQSWPSIHDRLLELLPKVVHPS